MRIAFVSLMSGAAWGGSELLWHSLALHALDNGDDVFVSIYDWGKLHEKIEMLKSKGAIIYKRKRYDAAAGFIKKIIRFILNKQPALNSDYQSIIDFKPDHIFLSQGDTFDLVVHHKVLYKLMHSQNVKYSFVCHSHTQYGFIPPAEIYPSAIEVFKNAHKIFFVSKRQWKLTERRLATKLENGAFTWNPLNLQLPTSPLTFPETDIIQMALVASIDGNKGHDTAFEVLSTEKWQQRKWRLNIYGSGEGTTYLLDLANYFDVGDKVVFHGYVNGILNLWKQNHVLLIPSAGEGLPISLVEAMACGRPAIVTDVGGNVELIEEDITGYIAASPTVSSFDSALEKAWRNKNNWKELGSNAFEKINSILDKAPQKTIYELIKNDC